MVVLAAPNGFSFLGAWPTMMRLPLLPGYFAFETNFVISCDNVVRGRNEEL